MRGEVTQDNLHLFIYGKIAGTAMLIARAGNKSLFDALREFYSSRTCKLLEREDTKYWHYSPAQLYQVMLDDAVNAK